MLFDETREPSQSCDVAGWTGTNCGKWRLVCPDFYYLNMQDGKCHRLDVSVPDDKVPF